MVIDISELWDGGPNVGDFPIEKNYNVYNFVKMHIDLFFWIYISKVLTE